MTNHTFIQKILRKYYQYINYNKLFRDQLKVFPSYSNSYQIRKKMEMGSYGDSVYFISH